MPVVKTSKSSTSGRNQLPEVTTIYTDGACSGNPGPGGWGAIAHLSNGQIHEIGGAAQSTTNNRMEIQAAIEILRWVAASPQTTPPVLYTDSKYVQDGITKWIKGWKKKNWKTTAGKPVLNQDLWQQLDDITQSVNAQLSSPVQWRYVKGHAGNEGNERCDAIARDFSKGRHPALMTVTPWSDEGDRPLASAALLEEPAVNPEPETTISDQKSRSAPVKKDASSTALSKDDMASPNGQDGASKSTGTTTSDGIIGASDQVLQRMIERLRIADEIASNGYWLTTPELAHLLGLTTSKIDSKGERWVWRNWSVLKVRQTGTPTLWQLERVD